jgi:uracil-DNA glycosylase family 4
MDRREAMLRELNLYPQWKLREGGAAGSGHPAAPPCVNSVQPSAGNGLPDLVMRGLRSQSAPNAGNPLSVEADAELPPQVVREEPAAISRAAEAVVSKVIDKATPPLPGPSALSGREKLGNLGWAELKQQVRECTICRLRAGCTQTVFGVGDEKADWLFVGEGPGADEDALGEPFVGQAGKLLDSMLMAIKLKRGNNVYIANIVKCRPPGNRNPEADEIAACLPYLQRQIELIQPKLIVALGKVASNALLGRDATLASLRGKLHDYRGIPLIVTYHPAYLLRSPTEKAKAWQDLCMAVRARHGEA